MTPFFCGNFHEGYRRSQCYGGHGGVSLGTAIAISGAAANPHMGYCSSPALGFLMTLFNARLGAWLGNTNRYGDRTYWLPGPQQALWPLFAELFGITTQDFKYINLSDGGHFDNLGLYEVVLRRCRYSWSAMRAATATASSAISATRSARSASTSASDHFKREIEIRRTARQARPYCAVAHINYSRSDGEEATPGR